MVGNQSGNVVPKSRKASVRVEEMPREEEGGERGGEREMKEKEVSWGRKAYHHKTSRGGVLLNGRKSRFGQPWQPYSHM